MSQSRAPQSRDNLERTRYFPRQVITPSDLDQDRDYVLHKFRRQNRMLIGWGIVHGLTVRKMTGDEAKKWMKDGTLPGGPGESDFLNYWLVIESGYALTPLGDEIYLPDRVFVNTIEELDDALVTWPSSGCTTTNPRKKNRNKSTLALIVTPLESEACPVRAPNSRCGDHPEQFESSRVRDILRFNLREKAPDKPSESNSGLLTGKDARKYIALGQIEFEGDKIKDISGDYRDQWLKKTYLPTQEEPPVVVTPPVTPPAKPKEPECPPTPDDPATSWFQQVLDYLWNLLRRFWNWFM